MRQPAVGAGERGLASHGGVRMSIRSECVNGRGMQGRGVGQFLRLALRAGVAEQGGSAWARALAPGTSLANPGCNYLVRGYDPSIPGIFYLISS